MPRMIVPGKELSTVELNWQEVIYTKLPEASELHLVSVRLG